MMMLRMVLVSESPAPEGTTGGPWGEASGPGRLSACLTWQATDPLRSEPPTPAPWQDRRPLFKTLTGDRSRVGCASRSRVARPLYSPRTPLLTVPLLAAYFAAAAQWNESERSFSKESKSIYVSIERKRDSFASRDKAGETATGKFNSIRFDSIPVGSHKTNQSRFHRFIIISRV